MYINEQQSKIGDVIAKAWSDSTFLERLKAAPNLVLANSGIELPPELEIKVVENTANTAYFVVPARPNTGSAVADEDIEANGIFQANISKPCTITCPSLCITNCK